MPAHQNQTLKVQIQQGRVIYDLEQPILKDVSIEYISDDPEYLGARRRTTTYRVVITLESDAVNYVPSHHEIPYSPEAWNANPYSIRSGAILPQEPTTNPDNPINVNILELYRQQIAERALGIPAVGVDYAQAPPYTHTFQPEELDLYPEDDEDEYNELPYAVPPSEWGEIIDYEPDEE